MTTVTDDADSLRRGIRDLVALTTLSNIWTGSPPQTIINSLSDVLLNMLRLDLVYIRLNNVRGSIDQRDMLEIVRTPVALYIGAEGAQMGTRFAPYLEDLSASHTYQLDDSDSDSALKIVTIPLGLNGLKGVIVTGTHNTAALSEFERLLLSVAANQAMPALQQAYLMSDLRAAYTQADEANRIKVQFVAMIAHELRTPLTSIKGFASSLLSEDIEFSREDQRDYLQVIDSEANTLADLIEQLLDLSRLQANSMRIAPEPTAVETLINLIHPRLTIITAEHGLVINLPDTPIMLDIDSARIGQVITNLVQNAVKFSPPAAPITVRVTQRGNKVQFDVQDQGIGIPVEERPRLFEAFKQVERESYYHKGVGLGLAICKGLVERHGGTIWIEDNEGPGTTISFALPILQG